VTDLEAKIRELTKPVNGQYPRPWMTKMKNPERARIFVVGYNDAVKFPASKITHKKFLNALFNRGIPDCRGLYDEVTKGRPRPSRNNIDKLIDTLESKGLRDVLGTNVICYSTPMGPDIGAAEHDGGFEIGTKIFQCLVRSIKPKIIIIHGKGAREKVEKLFGIELPEASSKPTKLSEKQITLYGALITFITIKSLSPPEANKWARWRCDSFDLLATTITKKIGVD
jgi:hypothetical protein